MLVECTVHIGGARLITIRQLASLVQLFLLKAEDFSLVFLSSSTSTYRISRSQPYRVCQTWLLEGAERAGRTRRVRSAQRPLPTPDLLFYPLFLLCAQHEGQRSACSTGFLVVSQESFSMFLEMLPREFILVFSDQTWTWQSCMSVLSAAPGKVRRCSVAHSTLPVTLTALLQVSP